MKLNSYSLAILLAIVSGVAVKADTVAYWRFEEGPALANVPHTLAPGAFEGTIPDVSGQGNTLSVWEAGGGAGYTYRADVPSATIPLTGVANNFSVKNTGGGPAMFTGSAVSNPSGINAETIKQAVDAGVDWYVVASAIFDQSDRAAAIADLRRRLNGA